MRLASPWVRIVLATSLGAVAYTTPAAACTISAVAVNFGAYDPRSASEKLGYGTINLSCPSGVASTAQLSISTGTSGTFTTRRMTSGANVLQYNLYVSSAAGALIWGDGTGGSATVSVAGAGTTTATTVYGRISAGQNVMVGTYSDATIVTVTF